MSDNQTSSPLIVQSDRTILLERASPNFSETRDFLMRFSELVKCPEHYHTYLISQLSLWNAVSVGMKPEDIIFGLDSRAKYPISTSIKSFINDTCSIYGKFRLVSEDNKTYLEILDEKFLPVLSRVININNCLAIPYEESLSTQPWFAGTLNPKRLQILREMRGHLKVKFMDEGYPIHDIAGYRDGEPYEINLKESLKLRNYQEEAAYAFSGDGSVEYGSGVLVLPCGAGKTIIGISAIANIKRKTLIVTPSTMALLQWKRELLNHTTLQEEEIAEYSGNSKNLGPVTITTYQLLTGKHKAATGESHLEYISKIDWGLVVYDEVHLLPAPIFALASSVQASKRLGLTATLVREDKKEGNVFSLIGPKKYDVPWKELEDKGWIANAECLEVRVALTPEYQQKYDIADKKHLFTIASTNPGKIAVIQALVEEHRDRQILIIGMYVEQLKEIAQFLSLPHMDGATPTKKREELLKQFRDGEIKTLVLSKVGNNAIDLPEASVAIQVSGMFGSRQEEAQRLGRILRPKKKGEKAYFYSVVSNNTEEMRFAMNRQLFLIEQGYEYKIVNVEEVEKKQDAVNYLM